MWKDAQAQSVAFISLAEETPTLRTHSPAHLPNQSSGVRYNRDSGQKHNVESGFAAGSYNIAAAALVVSLLTVFGAIR